MSFLSLEPGQPVVHPVGSEGVGDLRPLFLHGIPQRRHEQRGRFLAGDRPIGREGQKRGAVHDPGSMKGGHRAESPVSALDVEEVAELTIGEPEGASEVDGHLRPGDGVAGGEGRVSCLVCDPLRGERLDRRLVAPLGLAGRGRSSGRAGGAGQRWARSGWRARRQHVPGRP